MDKKEFCWSCRKEKENVDQSTGTYYSGICLDCRTAQEKQLKDAKAELILNDINMYVGWYAREVTLRRAYIKHGDKTYLIGGLYTCDPVHDTCDVFEKAQQFIDSGFKCFRVHGNFDMLKKHDFWFHIEVHQQFYVFGGNCNHISNAFTLRTLDINEIWDYIEIYTDIPQSMKDLVKEYLDNGFVFASNPEPHQEAKIFCFRDYSYYEATKQAKIIKLSDLCFELSQQPDESRMFDGKKYVFATSWEKEENALNYANSLREEGYQVRTIKIGAVYVNYKYAGNDAADPSQEAV